MLHLRMHLAHRGMHVRMYEHDKTAPCSFMYGSHLLKSRDSDVSITQCLQILLCSRLQSSRKMVHPQVQSLKVLAQGLRQQTLRSDHKLMLGGRRGSRAGARHAIMMCRAPNDIHKLGGLRHHCHNTSAGCRRGRCLLLVLCQARWSERLLC